MSKKEFLSYLAAIFVAGNPLVWVLLLFCMGSAAGANKSW